MRSRRGFRAKTSRTAPAGRLPGVSLEPFEKVVAEHGPAILRVCRAVAGPQEAEDVWSETFLSALRSYEGLRPDSRIEAWLVTIAHRKAIDQHRANGRRPVPVAETAEVAVEDPAPTGDGIWELVGALPPKQRAAVALRYACDLPHAEIAAALGCSPEAARRSLHEGMKRLRKELA